MSGEPSRAIMLFGTEEPAPETVRLEAGPLACTLDAGNLRQITLHGREAIRAVSFIARDRNWGTYTPEIRDLQIERRGDGFTVSYDAVCRDAAQELSYMAEITGHPGGLEFVVDGKAVSAWATNRTGFVVLHGVEGISGAPVEVEHTDGTVERTRFPELISPAQPIKDIRTLTHEVLPGLRVACRMEGDAYEMEDQRNWMDASYKTYIRPLSKPWPYTLAAGERLEQRVTLEVEGSSAPPVSRGGAAVAVEVGALSTRTMPRLGLAVPSEHAATALQLSDTLAVARPSYVVGHLDLGQGHGADELASYRDLAARLDVELVIEAVLPCADANGQPTDDPGALEADLAALREHTDAAGATIGHLIVSPACYLKSYQPDAVWPKAPDLALVYDAARRTFPGAAIGGGVLAYFTELNRKRPPAEALDLIGHTLCPLVHAADDLSLTEGLESLPSIFASTRAFAGGKPYWLYPTAISMRANPYGAAPLESVGNRRTAMSRNDPRERALIGAAWYAGLMAHAARAGLDAVTMGAAAGPSGIAYAGMPWPQPWFDEGGAPVLPSFHVFHQHARFAGESQLETQSSAPRDVQCLAFRSSTGPRLWLVNLTGEAREVAITGLEGSRAHVHAIDETTFVALCRDPAAFDGLAVDCPLDRITLRPYAAARIDAFP